MFDLMYYEDNTFEEDNSNPEFHKEFIDKIKAREAENKMSFVSSIIFPDKIIIASDSRNTINGNIYRDNIYKTIYIPKIKTAIAITGLNSFTYGHKVLYISDFINNFDFKSAGKDSMFSEITEFLYQQFVKYNVKGSTFLSFYTFRDTKPLCGYSEISLTAKWYKNIDELNNSKNLNPIVYTQGALYARQIWDHNIIPFHFLNDMTDSQIIEEINFIFEKIKSPAAQELFNNKTVGGPVRIGKLTIKDYEWLQNRPFD